MNDFPDALNIKWTTDMAESKLYIHVHILKALIFQSFYILGKPVSYVLYFSAFPGIYMSVPVL